MTPLVVAEQQNINRDTHERLQVGKGHSTVKRDETAELGRTYGFYGVSIAFVSRASCFMQADISPHN